MKNKIGLLAALTFCRAYHAYVLKRTARAWQVASSWPCPHIRGSPAPQDFNTQTRRIGWRWRWHSGSQLPGEINPHFRAGGRRAVHLPRRILAISYVPILFLPNAIMLPQSERGTVLFQVTPCDIKFASCRFQIHTRILRKTPWAQGASQWLRRLLDRRPLRRDGMDT